MHTCPLCNGSGQIEGNIASRLVEARKAKNLTQMEACEHLGLRRASLAMIETGRSAPQPDFLVRAARLYGVSTDHILGVDLPATN